MDKQNDLISVIIPAYNAEPYIKKSISSVLNQTHRNFEIIIIDDGSTDATAEVIQSYLTDKRIKLIRVTNGGVSYARNIGIDNAQGKYIMFLDADDELVENALEITYKYIEKNQADLCVGDTISGKEDDFNREGLKDESSLQEKLYKQCDFLEAALKDNPITWSAGAKLYLREFITDIRFEEGRKVNEDSFFVFQCATKQPKVVYINSTIYHYITRDNSASRAKFSDKFFDILYFAEQKVDIIQKQYPEYLSLVKNVVFKAKLAMLFVLLRSKDKKHKSIEKELIIYIKNNRKDFIPAVKSDITRLNLVRFNLYPLYKFFYTLKRGKNE